MESAVWIGFIAFFVVSLVVGIRLLALWARTQELPELLIGAGVLGIGPVGFGLYTVGDVVSRGSNPGPAQGLFAVAAVAVSLGVLSVWLFNWRVYHARRRWVGALVWGVGGILAGVLVGEAMETGFRQVRLGSPNYLLRTGLQVAALLWSAVEALRYWRMMRRRARIGLVEPMVTNRFFLWGLAAGAAGLGSAIGLVTQAVTGKPALEIAWLMMSSSLHGLTAAVAMWLAFVPFEAYRRFIESRAPSAG